MDNILYVYVHKIVINSSGRRVKIGTDGDDTQVIYYIWPKYRIPFFGSNSDLIISQNLLIIFANLSCFDTFLKGVAAGSAMAGPVFIFCNFIM